jgi:8-oxo-dGTP pyrophosphatase MutT (NUDIX family)
MNKNIYCNNCGKKGHTFYNCCLPITSNGIIAFCKNKETGIFNFLMIRRKHTLGFIDFIRGKYLVYNKYYILNMIYQMTNQEKEMLKTMTFEDIWSEIWHKPVNFNKFKSEESISCDKFNQLRHGINSGGDFYTLSDLITMSSTNWAEQEWGFPKGRRNYNETDLDCSIREFVEETGIPLDKTQIVSNILPFEEIFFGSNYKSYKHKYFLAEIDSSVDITKFDTNEVSDIVLKPYSECVKLIRPYNLEKKRMLCNIDIILKKYILAKNSV